MASDAGSGIELLFLGTGTSAGVPMIGCGCETCTSTDIRDNRTRCSVVISYRVQRADPEAVPNTTLKPEDGHRPAAATPAPELPQETHLTRVLVDTTPELRMQAVANKVRRIAAIVYTHAHADHLMGLDDVRRFNTLKRGPLDVWADEFTHGILAQIFRYAFREPDPDSALYRPHLVPRIIDGGFEIDGCRWTPIPMIHGDMPVLGFRVGNLAYCTDVSEIPGASMELLGGLDVLVLDALQHRKHPTHFTITEALEVVAELKPRATYLTHMSHNVLHARDSKDLPENVFFAYDGLCISSHSTGPDDTMVQRERGLAQA